MSRASIPIFSKSSQDFESLLTREKIRGTIHFMNSYVLSQAVLNSTYRRILSDAHCVFVDGRLVQILLRIFAPKSKYSQVRGADFLRGVLAKSISSKGFAQKHFFLGGNSDLFVYNLCQENPSHTQQFQSYSLPFSDLDQFNFSQIMTAIDNFSPDVIWISLGTPKQDYFASKLSSSVSIPCVAIGAAVDFLVDPESEANLNFQKLGLEWLFRLTKEPKRLWKRYLIYSPLAILSPLFVKFFPFGSK